MSCKFQWTINKLKIININMNKWLQLFAATELLFLQKVNCYITETNNKEINVPLKRNYLVTYVIMFRTNI